MAEAIERTLVLRFQGDFSQVAAGLDALEARAGRSFGAGGTTFGNEGPAVGGGPAPVPGAAALLTPRFGATFTAAPTSGGAFAGGVGGGGAQSREDRAAERAAAAAERRAAALERAAQREESRLGSQFDAIIRTANRYDRGGTVTAAEAAAEDAQSGSGSPSRSSGGGHGFAGGGFYRHFGAFALLRTGEQLIRNQTAYDDDVYNAAGDPAGGARAALQHRQRYDSLFFGLGTYGRTLREEVFAPFTGEATTRDIQRSTLGTEEQEQRNSLVASSFASGRSLNREAGVAGAPEGLARRQAENVRQREERDDKIRAEQTSRLQDVENRARRERARMEDRYTPGWSMGFSRLDRQAAAAGFANVNDYAAQQRETLGGVIDADARHERESILSEYRGRFSQSGRISADQLRDQNLPFEERRQSLGLDTEIFRDRAGGARGRAFELSVTRRRNAQAEYQADQRAHTPQEMRDVRALGERNQAEEDSLATENRRVSGLENYSLGTRAGVAGLQARRMGFEASVYGQFRAGNESVAQADPAQQGAARQAANAELGKAIAEGIRSINLQNQGDANATELSGFALRRDSRGAALARARQERDQEIEAAGGGISGLARLPGIYARYLGARSVVNQEYNDRRSDFAQNIAARNQQLGIQLGSADETPSVRAQRGQAASTVNRTIFEARDAARDKDTLRFVPDILAAGQKALQLQSRNYIQSFQPEEVDPNRTAVYGAGTEDSGRVLKDLADAAKTLKDVPATLQGIQQTINQRLGVAL